jgi:hypothetical protein
MMQPKTSCEMNGSQPASKPSKPSNFVSQFENFKNLKLRNNRDLLGRLGRLPAGCSSPLGKTAARAGLGLRLMSAGPCLKRAFAGHMIANHLTSDDFPFETRLSSEFVRQMYAGTPKPECHQGLAASSVRPTPLGLPIPPRPPATPRAGRAALPSPSRTPRSDHDHEPRPIRPRRI